MDILFSQVQKSEENSKQYRKQEERLLYIFNFLYFNLFTLALILHFGEGKNRIPILRYACKYYKSIYYVIWFIHFFWFSIGAFAAEIVCEASFLALVNPLFQIELLTNGMKNNTLLNAGRHVKLTKLIQNENYQKMVSKELKCIYIYHLKLLRYIKKFNGCPHVRIMGSLIMYSGMAVIPLVMLCTLAFHSIEGYISGVLLIIVILINTIILFNAGQFLEDQFKNIHHCLLYMPWHVWNIENLKTYLLFLTQTHKPVHTLISFNIKVNREAGLNYVKIIYIIMMFIYQTNLIQKF
ncbi:uncharacterized protein LOC115885192 [Sitophilus oryzae]|uniref:Uncharacterized protein LOC115885192 n=1 Tax=Sitophilus oryzae TaxID=7048 RepID=A0A6J2Y9G3_SITOR|nr:uncharacterized protein LOC115885192 [Sitophilus oryzae]